VKLFVWTNINTVGDAEYHCAWFRWNLELLSETKDEPKFVTCKTYYSKIQIERVKERKKESKTLITPGRIEE
jgi:hypothetical protein